MSNPLPPEQPPPLPDWLREMFKPKPLPSPREIFAPEPQPKKEKEPA